MFQAIIRLKAFWMLAVVRSTVNPTQCLLQGWRECVKVVWIQLQEKTEKNPHHQLYQQKRHLMVIDGNEETLNVNKVC